MSGPNPHPQQGSGGDAQPPSESSTEELVAADLRRQVAILAEQVRRLGERPSADALARRIDAAGEPRAPAAVELPLPPAPRPRAAASASSPPPTQLEVEPLTEPAIPEPERRDAPETEHAGGRGAESAGVVEAEPAGGVEAESARVSQTRPSALEAPSVEQGESFEHRSRRLISSVINLAELAAVEIRTSAELEAAAIRARSSERLSAPSADHLAALLERQRQMLSALAAQTERVERAAGVVRAQIRALEAERDHIDRLLESLRREP
jgi:hypothetical protein